MRLCPEEEFRNSLTDEEYWEYVFRTEYSDWTDFDDSDRPDLGESCPVCGSTGECGYDLDGRPIIHSIKDEDEYD